MIDITSHRRIARRPVSVRRRKVAKRVCEKMCTEWRVLESGVLAIKTGVEIVTEKRLHHVWYDPLNGGRLVCPHGWGQWHLSSWNGPRAHLFPKPTWTTCDCGTATGLCSRKRGACGQKGVGDCFDACASVPSYYDVLLAAQSAEELRPGLCGVRVPGVYGLKGEPFYMVKGDVAKVLRCNHGQTTNTLNAQARERRGRAASLVAAALFGRRLAHRALGGMHMTDPPPDRGTRRALVCLILALHVAREARRTRRGVAPPCGCTPVHVKAKMTRCR